jgi:hypothetical protein
MGRWASGLWATLRVHGRRVVEERFPFSAGDARRRFDVFVPIRSLPILWQREGFDADGLDAVGRPVRHVRVVSRTGADKNL